MHIINPKAATDKENRDFPGGLVVRIPAFTAMALVLSLVGELRSHKLCSVTKKQKRKGKNENKMDYKRHITRQGEEN